MSYEKDSIKDAKKIGAFDNNVLDPKILEMNASDKQKLSDELARVKQDMEPQKQASPQDMSKRRKKEHTPLDVELTFLEKIMLFFLTIFGFSNAEQFKKKKVIRNIEKDIARIKPPIYLLQTRRISKFFAHKLHDLYLKIVWIKRMMDLTLNNKKYWDNPSVSKAVAESLFERLANLNTDEVDSNFSPSGIEMVVSQFEDPRTAVETVEKSFYTFVYSIDKTLVEKVNEIYTNLSYFRDLCDYDFYALFKRFDPTFHPGVTPNFIDIPGEGILGHLEKLEEAILQIDLNIDNIFIFKKLLAVSKEFENMGMDSPESGSADPMANIAPKTTAIQGLADGITPEKLESELLILFEILKELLYTKSLTLLIQMIKVDPLYAPSFVHTRHDLFKVYVETFEKRIKVVSKNVIRSRRKRTLENLSHQLFGQMKWVGIYNIELSDEIEKIGFTGFFFTFHIATVMQFLERYYNEFLKNTINILLLNGVYSEKNFHKLTSDTFYAMDKFVERFQLFAEDVSPEGTEGKRLLGLLARKDSTMPENRKIVEKHIVTINGKARDLFEEFNRHFSSIHTIISKVYKDIDSKPPKYIRNIRSIGGFRNVKFLQSLEKGMKILQGIQELTVLLKQ
jgi:hypothetical protein